MLDATESEQPYRYWRPDPPLPRPDDIVRFWSYVLKGDVDECWPWRTLKRGMFWWRDTAGEKQHQVSPRLAYRLANDCVDLPPRSVIGHRCDWRACCNPDHLECISQRKNSIDMANRGLHPYKKSGLYRYTRRAWWENGRNGPGEGNGFAKLTDEQVDEIRARYASGGIRQVDLAAEYGIGQSHVSRIVRGEVWAHRQ